MYEISFENVGLRDCEKDINCWIGAIQRDFKESLNFIPLLLLRGLHGNCVFVSATLFKGVNYFARLIARST